VIEYDQYGRQVERTYYTNHGYGNQGKPAEYHSDPHTHTEVVVRVVRASWFLALWLVRKQLL